MKRNYYIFVLLILLFLGGISLAEGGGDNLEEALLREEPGEGEKEVELELEIPELEEKGAFPLVIEERVYTGEEREKLFERARREIDESFAAEGQTVEHITSPVYLPETLQNGLVRVDWDLGETGVIREDGSIDSSKAERGGTLVQVKAELTYQAYSSLYEFPVCIYPGKVTGIDGIRRELEEYLEDYQTREAEKKAVALPGELLGYKLNWKKEGSHTFFLILGLGILAFLLVPWCLREQEEKQRQARRRRMELDYPGMLAEFALLLGAGMTVRAVWEKLVRSYEWQLKQGRRKESELYEQMRQTFLSIQDGTGEGKAYENFGRRCELPCCRRFAMLLIQNLEKGGKGLAQTLELEADQAFEDRKNLAKRQGEEAGTRLLLPMLLMLGIVIAVMLIPACMTMEL